MFSVIVNPRCILQSLHSVWHLDLLDILNILTIWLPPVSSGHIDLLEVNKFSLPRPFLYIGLRQDIP